MKSWSLQQLGVTQDNSCLTKADPLMPSKATTVWASILLMTLLLRLPVRVRPSIRSRRASPHQFFLVMLISSLETWSMRMSMAMERLIIKTKWNWASRELTAHPGPSVLTWHWSTRTGHCSYWVMASMVLRAWWTTLTTSWVVIVSILSMPATVGHLLLQKQLLILVWLPWQRLTE